MSQIETPKEPEVIAELRGWHREVCERLFTIGEVLAVDIADILAAYDTIVAERDAAVRDTQVVREIRARRNVVVEASPELLTNGKFTDQPLHVMLNCNGDGTHRLTFRVSDTIRELRQQLDASQRFSDEAVRAHTECERRLREATTRLAACEKIVAAAGKAREALLISADLLEIAVSSDDGLDASEAVVGINAARNAVLLLESQGIADPHAAVAAETHTDDEFGPNDGEARTVHRRAETQGEKDA